MNAIVKEIISPVTVCLRCLKKFPFVRIQASSCTTKAMKIQQPQQQSLKTNLVKTFGQPTHLTHPERLTEGEITPGIHVEEFRARRNRLIESIESYAIQRDLKQISHLIIIPSSFKKYMTEKIPYIFRQNSDFLYLTGCLEPDSVLLLTSTGVGSHRSMIFLRGKDPHSELWDGPRTGVDQAVEFFGVDNALPVDHLETYLSSFLRENRDCMLWYDYINPIHPVIHKLMKEFLSQVWNKMWESPKPFIHRLRLYKSPAEQELMKKSCQISCKAIKSTIKNSKPWDNEAQIFARVDFESRMNGAEYLAYPPVVAGGDRANIIHYINNDRVVKDGELVLMDAGCEYHSYTSDVTRTWPINGRFSSAQRELYEIVYSVQTELIQMCSSFPNLDQLFNAMCKLLGYRLRDAGVISNKNEREEDLPKIAYSFCPHHVSHYLGMDVHDTSTVPRNINLEPGMVVTIEPGIYVHENNKYANPKYHGLGIRIEDDILMTNSGPIVLTLDCPKHPDDIEKLILTGN